MAASASGAGSQIPTGLADTGSFHGLFGTWRCEGAFANGKPIAASIEFALDERSGALVVHHDDQAPNSFHDLELWGPASGGGYRATISDAFGGMRWLASPGWLGGRLQWTRQGQAGPVEALAYSPTGTRRMKVEWFRFTASGESRLGDTLDCRKVL